MYLGISERTSQGLKENYEQQYNIYRSANCEESYICTKKEQKAQKITENNIKKHSLL